MDSASASEHQTSDTYEVLTEQNWALQLALHDLTGRVQRSEALIEELRQEQGTFRVRLRWLEHFLAALRGLFQGFLQTPSPEELV